MSRSALRRWTGARRSEVGWGTGIIMPFRRGPVDLPVCPHGGTPSTHGNGCVRTARGHVAPAVRRGPARRTARRGRRRFRRGRFRAVAGGGDVRRAFHRFAVDRPEGAVVGVEARGDVVRAARELGGQPVLGGTQPGQQTTVEIEPDEAASGHGHRAGTGGREAEVAQGQPDRPAVLVGVRLDLDTDFGCVLCVHLTVVPALLVGVVQHLAHRRGRVLVAPVVLPARVTGATAGRAAEQGAHRERREQSARPRHVGERRTFLRHTGSSPRLVLGRRLRLETDAGLLPLADPGPHSYGEA